MKVLIIAMLVVTAQAATKPTCSDTSDACLDAWYQFGDQTGDYGVIDNG